VSRGTPLAGDGADGLHWLETGRLAELGLLSAELVHELRQPLAGARALTQLLHPRLSPDARAELGRVLEHLTRMERMLERWSVAGRRADPLPRPMALAPAVAAAVELLGPRARGLGRAVRWDDAEAGAVHADPLAVQQIATNLLANALDAARAEVCVIVRGATVTVSDDGAGIPEALRPHIFEVFTTTKPPGHGTGLGLPITQRLADACGATLHLVTSAAGTSFEVRFPPIPDVPPAATGETG
jgi:two-component system C4-dicarboxylate transport sensor histidine kinase DctB